jgi:hypothetical protein
MGWFCESTSELAPKNYYLFALRSNRKCDGPCSNLMGWYAIQKSDGGVFEWDMGELKVRPMGYYESLPNPSKQPTPSQH